MIKFNEYRSEPEVRMNIPFLIRLLEYAREDVKTDIDLHKVVEKITALGDKTITMADYKRITI